VRSSWLRTRRCGMDGVGQGSRRIFAPRGVCGNHTIPSARRGHPMRTLVPWVGCYCALPVRTLEIAKQNQHIAVSSVLHFSFVESG
jgi:hypothetical protein